MYPQDKLDIKNCTCSSPLFEKILACVKPLIAADNILFLLRGCHEWKFLLFSIWSHLALRNTFCCCDALMEKFLLQLVQNLDTVAMNNHFAVRPLWNPRWLVSKRLFVNKMEQGCFVKGIEGLILQAFTNTVITRKDQNNCQT